MLKVMLLEDDVDLCDVLEDKLVSRGYDVFAFNNHKDALRCIKSGEKFDIILIDLVDGVEGPVGHKVIDLAKQLGAPVIFAMSGSIDANEIRNEHIDFFLGKPFSLKDLENGLVKLKNACHP
jgi:CheY-like chemotaxis protein